MKLESPLARFAIAFALASRTGLAQPGPNAPVSQGGSNNGTGDSSDDANDDRKDNYRLTDEDGSPGRGFVFERGDGDFGLNVRARIQVRTNVGGSELEKVTERLDAGPSIARARLVVQGYAKKVWLYRLQLGAAPAYLSGDPSSPLVDSHITWSELRSARSRRADADTVRSSEPHLGDLAADGRA